jgi:ubiquinone/menaquinone biosynthesis C-methylase UbiE
VKRLYALEPNPGMLRLAGMQRHRTTVEIEFLTLPGERIPLEDGSVDTVVSTFTLCTIPVVNEALLGIARVLKRNGLLIFLENSLATDPAVQRWQRRWEPIHRRVFEGLLLTRDIPSLIIGAGLRIERVERVYLTRFPKSWSACCWGTARKG